MIWTVLLTLAIAGVLTPLIQRDLRAAHARIEARRRRRAMHPLEVAGLQMAKALARFGIAMQAMGVALNARDEQDVKALRKALKAGRRRRRDRWSIR